MAKRDLAAGDRIELYLDHHTVGAGYRRFTVVKLGRKWATLLYLPTLTALDLTIDELHRNPSLVHVESDPRTLRRLIRATLRERKQLGLRSATAAAKTVLDQLEKGGADRGLRDQDHDRDVRRSDHRPVH